MNIEKHYIEDFLIGIDFKKIQYNDDYAIFEKRLKYYNDILEILIDYKKPDNNFEFTIFLNDETKVFEGSAKTKIKNILDFKKIVLRIIDFADDFTLFL